MNAFQANMFNASEKLTVAYVIEPRFPGGTSSAIAQELRAVAGLAKIRIFGISSAAFKDRQVAAQLEESIEYLGFELEWDPSKICADVVILHNPSFLKFQTELKTKIFARRLFVVTHENFLRPGGELSFDVSSCLDQIDRAVLASEKILAPISEYNRKTVTNWIAETGAARKWDVLSDHWFNICEFEQNEPTGNPQDRRGRLSRSGFEKFPSLDDMELCFPKSAQSNVLLGADVFTSTAADYPHWNIVPFKGMEVSDFFEKIDFLVYFTSPTLQESFGRVLAEGIAAGKVVITDANTGSNFGGSVVAASPTEVNKIIAGFVENPKSYQNHVRNAQKHLKRFSKGNFAKFFSDRVISKQECAE